MKTIDRQACKLIRATAETLLKPFATKEGLSVVGGNCSYTQNRCTLKLEFTLLDKSGKVVDVARQEYINFAESYGLKPEWLDRVLVLQGRPFKIVGLNMRSRKYPVVAESRGKRYKLTVASVFNHFITK